MHLFVHFLAISGAPLSSELLETLLFLQLGSAWLKMENLENKVDVLRGYGGFQEYVSLQKMSDLAKA